MKDLTSKYSLYDYLAFSLFIPLLLAFPEIAISAPVHAYYADEHNTSSGLGNRILEVDLDTMEIVNSLDVPGVAGHHADNTYNSKIYGVPKDSNFINVIKLRKGKNGSTSMELIKKINLIHKPRSGDAFNQKLNIVLLTASNRPMGSFIDVNTDKVVGTIGENVDCVLTDGSMLLSHADANTHSGAIKYHCANSDHGGNQISGHPYWLTTDYAVIVDRANHLLSVYRVWKEGSRIKSKFINSVHTRTSVHQIVPRDRTSLPLPQQADFYAVEEGKHANPADYSGGIPHALLKLKLTNKGLRLVKRMNLQRPKVLPKAKADRILSACVAIYRNTNNYRQGRTRAQAYDDLFQTEGIVRNKDQAPNNDYPVDCFYPGIPGGHNADFAPNNRHLYVPMAGGALSVIDVNRWKIVNNLDIGRGSGPGHVCFSKEHDLAITTNHASRNVRIIRNINSNRPTVSQNLTLPFPVENLTTTLQSHSCYIDENEEYYYNFWTDDGVFFKIDLSTVESNTINGNNDALVDWLYTGGVPIQGSFLSLDELKSDGNYVPLAANNDQTSSNGSAITVDVLKNDTGYNIELMTVDPASNGQVSISNGQLYYVPNRGFSGKDNFWYAVSSNGGTWEWALVTVTVRSSVPHVSLKAKKDIVYTSIGQTKTIDVLSNDSGNDINIGWIDTPARGDLYISNNMLVYTPDNGFSGVEDFWYEISDSNGETTWGQVVITVGNGTVINNDKVTVNLGETVTVDVLANDIGYNLKIISLDSVWMGEVSIANGKILYEASGNESGNVDVWYGVEDISGNTKWAVLTITVKR